MESKIRLDKILYDNEYGGFSEDGKEYKIKIKNGERTPLPWCHVLSNELFGTLLTSNGGGYTWYGNSRENKLTVWSNDAIEDSTSEMIFIKGKEKIYTAMPYKVSQDYLITYGFGYAIYETNYEGIHQSLTIFVPNDKNEKINQMFLKNETDERKDLHIFYWINPVLGVTREETKKHLILQKNDNSIELNNYYREIYSSESAFINSSEPIINYTCEKDDIKNGEIKKTEEGICKNPCVIIEIDLSLEPQQEKTICFSISVGEKTNFSQVEQSLESTKLYWEKLLNKVQIKTPVESMNIMMNGWLLYQTLASRLYARTGFYQAGGAFGFRDQLQDVLSLLVECPEIAKKQILYHAAHQFQEGDVLHWWHPEKNNGIRTRYRDDLLWLPYVVSEYVKVTGDFNILDEEIPYIEGKLLEDNENEIYQEVKQSTFKESLCKHCIRAIENSLQYGTNGLPKMEGGDWNDGMNLVGGESIWLGFFLYDVLNKFLIVLDKKDELELKEKYKNEMQKLKQALNQNGWDGRWYKRAFFKDGTPLRLFTK